jgi:hypothetical protein
VIAVEFEDGESPRLEAAIGAGMILAKGGGAAGGGGD